MGSILRAVTVVAMDGTISRPVRTAVIWPLRTAALIGLWCCRSSVALVTPPRAEGWLDDEPDPGERFRRAARRYGRREGDFARLKDVLWRRWALFSILTACAAGWGMIVSAAYATLHGPLGTLMPFALLPAPLALAMQAAFHHWQIRRRSLDGLTVFLRDPGGWVPPGDRPSGRSLASWLVVCTAAALLAAPGVAWASSSTTATDQALTILQALLPFQSGLLAAQATAFSSALGVLSSFLTGVGSGMLAFHSIAGVASTAHEGKVLGARWNTMWAPIRVVTGFCLLAPLPSGSGFSTIHGAIYDIAVEMNGVTNDIWTTYVTKTLGADTAATTAPGIPSSVGGAVLAEEIARSEICTDVLLVRAAVSGATAAVSLPDPAGKFVANSAPKGAAADGSGLQVWQWGGPCGSLSLPVPASSSPAPVTAFSAARIGAVASLLTTMRNGAVSLAQQAAQWAEGNGGAIGTTAFPTSIQSALDSVGQTYDSTMLTAAATLSADQNKSARENLKDAASAGGWMLAFSYDRALAQASQQTATLASEAPNWTRPLVAPSAKGLGAGADKEGIDAYNKVLAALDDELAKERGAGQLTAADLSAAGQADDGYIAKLLEPLDHRMSQAVIDYSAANSNDPISDMMSLGAKLTAAGEAASAASLALSFGACNTVSNATGACDAYKTAMTLVRPLIWACLAAGVTLQFILPMLGWIAGLHLAIGWTVGLAEVAIAGPLMAFLWIRMDGQELVDSVQRPALIILANWALRPALGILGYCAGRTIIPLCMPLLGKFGTAFIGAQGGHFAGVAGTLAGVLLLSFLTYQLMARLYSMTITIPDRLPRLFGMPGDGMADAGANEGGNRTMVAAVGAGGRMAPSTPGGGGNGGSGGGRGGGGGGAPGVRPVGSTAADARAQGDMVQKPVGGADSGGGTYGEGGGSREAGADSWVNQGGGYNALSADQQAAASAAYDKMLGGGGRRAEWAQEIGLDGYVSHVQNRQAERRGD
jgi:conjugal transfer/type IV secretion protein DotA/TraY